VYILYFAERHGIFGLFVFRTKASARRSSREKVSAGHNYGASSLRVVYDLSSTSEKGTKKELFDVKQLESN
jgi:hypothetical protein